MMSGKGFILKPFLSFCPGEFSDNLSIFFKKSDLTFSKTFAIIILEVKGTAINLPEKNKKKYLTTPKKFDIINTTKTSCKNSIGYSSEC